MESRIMNVFGKILVGLGLIWYGALHIAKSLVISVDSWSLKGLNVSDGSVVLNLNFLLYNPISVGITINNIVGDVYAQGMKVGYVDMPLNYYLSGKQAHTVPVEINLNIRDLGSAAIQNIMSGDIRTLTIAFDGKIYAGKVNVGVPLQIELDYNSLMK